MISPLIVAVAGGSGSGKTTFSRYLQNELGQHRCAIISQDHYYIDQSAKFDHDGGSVNFDHPSAIDFELLTFHVELLKQGRAIEIPVYDFATHKRQDRTTSQVAMPIVIIDGILIFTNDKLLEQFDYKIYIDCEEQLRFERRLRRDVQERGRTPEGVKAQLMGQVKPMHDQFVEPSKVLADDIVCVRTFEQKCSLWGQKLKTHIN